MSQPDKSDTITNIPKIIVRFYPYVDNTNIVDLPQISGLNEYQIEFFCRHEPILLIYVHFIKEIDCSLDLIYSLIMLYERNIKVEFDHNPGEYTDQLHTLVCLIRHLEGVIRNHIPTYKSRMDAWSFERDMYL